MEKLRLEKGLRPGKYTAVLERVEEIDSKFGPALKFVYFTEDGQEASELVNMKYSPKSKLGKRVEALLDGLPEELDLQQLTSTRVVITLVEKDESDFCKVSTVKKVEQNSKLEVKDEDVPF